MSGGGEEGVSGAANGKSSAVPASNEPADTKSAPAAEGGVAVADASAAAAAGSGGVKKKPCFFPEPLSDAKQVAHLEEFRKLLQRDGLYSLSLPTDFDLPPDMPHPTGPTTKGVTAKQWAEAEAKRTATRQKNNYIAPATTDTATATAAAAPVPAPAPSAADAKSKDSAAPVTAFFSANASSKSQYELELELEMIRFCRARKWDLPAAYNQWKAFLVWRRDENVDGEIDRIDPMEDAFQSICPHSHHGWDKVGHPVYWEKTGYVHLPTLIKAVGEKGIIRRHVRYFEYVIRRMIHSSQRHAKNVSKQVVVFDLSYLSAKPDPTAIRIFKETLRIDSSYYPERLHQFFFINTPWYFRYSWAVVKPFLDAVTVAKFEVLSTDYHSRLKQFINDDQIPIEYGGKCTKCTTKGGIGHNPNGCIQLKPKSWTRPITETDRLGLIVWDELPGGGFATNETKEWFAETASGGKPVGPVPKSPACDPLPVAKPIAKK